MRNNAARNAKLSPIVPEVSSRPPQVNVGKMMPKPKKLFSGMKFKQPKRKF